MKLWLLKCLLAILRYMPLSAARSLGSILGRVVYRFNTRMATVARTNIGLCLADLPPGDQERLVKRCLQETGKTLFETGMSWNTPLSEGAERIRAVRNEKLFDDAIESGKGLLIILLHHGNWEMINHYLFRKGCPFAAIYKPPKDAGLDNWIKRSREKSGLSLYPVGRAGAEAVTDVVRNGGIAVYAPDQEPGVKSGVFAPLFGIEALTGTFTYKLLQENPGAAALCTTVMRREDGFEVVFRKADAQLYDTDVMRSTAALNRSIEPCILDRPEQYQWGYKRFKSRPANEARLYAWPAH